MEALKLPMREIRRTYTRSELAIMAWRSAEMSYNMDLQTAQSSIRSGSAESEMDVFELEQKLQPFAHRLTNQEGEVDLRKLTAQEVMQYFDAMGIGDRH